MSASLTVQQGRAFIGLDAGLQEELTVLRKQLAEAKTAAALAQARSLVTNAQVAGGTRMIVARLDNVDAKALQVSYRVNAASIK